MKRSLMILLCFVAATPNFTQGLVREARQDTWSSYTWSTQTSLETTTITPPTGTIITTITGTSVPDTVFSFTSTSTHEESSNYSICTPTEALSGTPNAADTPSPTESTDAGCTQHTGSGTHTGSTQLTGSTQHTSSGTHTGSSTPTGSSQHTDSGTNTRHPNSNTTNSTATISTSAALGNVIPHITALGSVVFVLFFSA